MAASGALTLDGKALAVTGEGWFDHQWGDFIAVGGGGWDWFAVNLEDGTDLTLSLVRAADGSYPLVYGTYVRPDGSFEHLDRGAFQVGIGASWVSPATGATYPAAWHVTLPGKGLVIDLRPTVAAQELDTRHDDRRRLLGGVAGGVRHARRIAGRGAGIRRADRLRTGSGHARESSPECIRVAAG